MGIDNYKEIKSYSDFLRLKDRKFVLWRLLRTQELSDFWRRFMAEHLELEEEFERAIAVCDSVRINERCYPDTDALYRRIEETILRQKRQRAKVVRMHRLMAAAAIALLLLIPATYLGYVRFMTVGEHQDELVGQILQSENVELLLGNRKIVLQDSADVRVKDGCIIYGAAGTKINLSSIGDAVCRLVVPSGKHSFLTLADLSKVWINSGTEVEFPATFASRSTRDIRVDGEIFIDVTKNPRHPFVVHTDKMDVTVRGTSFNVSAYNREQEASVVLVRGKVQVDARSHGSVTMQPNEMVALDNGKLSRQKVDVSYYVSWKDGYFAFNDTPVGEVLKKVGKYYNIRFSDTNAGISTKKITGKLYLSGNLDDVLTSISLITSTTYTRENNIVRLIGKERR